jgi:XRE family aerobic/anaerobic benzoate catabolism transcriptional regulator
MDGRDICVALGKRIRHLLKERGWRQIDLAEESGIHENYVSDIENGRKEICLRTLQTIARTFDLSIADLMKTVE